MRTLGSILTIAKVCAFGVAVATVAGCATSLGKIQADTPILPYAAPDVDELSGVDSDDADAAAEPAPAAPAAPAAIAAPAPTTAPAATAQNPHK